MKFNELKDKWDNMPAIGNGFLKLTLEHPLDIQIGYTGNIYKSFVVMDTGIIKNISPSFAVKVINVQLANGSWILEFQLIHPSFEEEFLRLCWDMIEYSSKEENPLNALIQRYITWQKFLQYENKDVLSFQRQKGLLGELIYLSRLIDDIGVEGAVDSWTGPDGSDQDFVFSSEWAEIKSISLASETIHISSLQQLQQESEGKLIVLILESTTQGDDRICLIDVVNEIKSKIECNVRYLDRFDMKLYKYGYRKNHENEYIDNQFRFIEQREYVVSNSFPKLVMQNVPTEIVSCKYELSLAAIDKYRG